MNKIEEKLKKFFDEGKMETRKESKIGVISAWINYYDVLEFAQIFEDNIFDDDGVESNMRKDCLWINFGSILDFYGIDEEYFQSL